MRTLRQNDAGVNFDHAAYGADDVAMSFTGSETAFLLLEALASGRRKALPAATVAGSSTVRRLLEALDFDEWQVWRVQALVIDGAVTVRSRIELVDVEYVLALPRIQAVGPLELQLVLPPPVMSSV